MNHAENKLEGSSSLTKLAKIVQSIGPKEPQHLLIQLVKIVMQNSTASQPNIEPRLSPSRLQTQNTRSAQLTVDKACWKRSSVNFGPVG